MTNETKPTYEGWTNYETWIVQLSINNDPQEQDYWLTRAGEGPTAIDLADELENDHRETAPVVAGVYGDLLTAAAGRVNWREIAESLLEQVPGLKRQE